MVDRATRWELAWQQSPLAACPQEVKDGVEDGTKIADFVEVQISSHKKPHQRGIDGMLERLAWSMPPAIHVFALSVSTPISMRVD
jgi:hypothetical protein